MAAQLDLLSLIPCFHRGLPENIPIHLTVKSLPTSLLSYQNVPLQAVILTPNSQPYVKLFPYTHCAPPAVLETLLPKCTVLFFLPKCCSHCSLALKFLPATQLLPSMASLLLASPTKSFPTSQSQWKESLSLNPTPL